MPENIRSHVVLAVITLILAVVILVLLFIPKPLPNQFQTSPGSGSQIPSSSQQASTRQPNQTAAEKKAGSNANCPGANDCS